jgi:hypothetical protein
MRNTAILAGAVLASFLCGAPAFADDCTPKLISALDMIDEPDGRIAVKVGLGGAQHRLLVATSNSHSELFQAAVTAAGFRQSNLPDNRSFEYFGGHAVGYATVDGMTLGSARGGTVQVLVTPGGYTPDPEVVGTLAADLLGNFDVEVNFQTRRINLFASNPCDGKQVYWSSAPSELTMADNALTVPMTLDGKEVEVGMDTLAVGFAMHFNTARALFGLDTTSPAVRQIAQRGDGGVYRHRFARLSAGVIDINNPGIALIGDPDAPACDGKARLRLGEMSGALVEKTCRNGGDLAMGVRPLRHLHLYFAYKARKVYFTLANAG